MKKIITLLFIVFVSYSKAQNKFPMPGADWHYEVLNGLGGVYQPYYSNIEIKYTHDTIINNQTAAVLSKGPRFQEYGGILDINNIYLYESNDSVFFYNNSSLEKWQLLYNFNALVGQSWQFTINNSNNITTTWVIYVDSINNIIINGNNLKELFVTYSDSAYPNRNYKSIITERLGDATYLFNVIDMALQACDGCPFVTGILCYQDSSFNLYQPDTSKPCNYYTLDIKQQAINNEQLNIYPNPAQNSLQITVNTGYIVQCILYDMLGNEVISTKVEEIDVSNLQNGVYFLQVKIDEGIITKKIIIQR
jgi:hypothetical protein